MNNKRNIQMCLVFITLFTLLFNKTCYLGGILKDINTILSLFVFVGIVVYYTISFYNSNVSKFSILFICYTLIGIIAGYLGEYSNVIDFIKMYYPVLGVVLLLDILFKNETKITILFLEKIFYLLITINFFSIIFFPNGLFADNLYTNNWFLMYDNLHICIFIPGLLISEIAGKFKRSKLTYYIMLIMVMFSVFYCRSATSVFAFILYILYLIFRKYLNKIPQMNSMTYFLVYILIFILVVVLRFQDYFRVIIVDLLDRDLTFTGRTFIWDAISKYISKKPLLGYGLEPKSIFTMKMGFKTYTHAHNTIYDVLYIGGIMLLIPFILMIIMSVKKLYKHKSNYYSKLISFVLFLFFIMMNFEAREDKVGLYIILLLGYHIENVIRCTESVSQRRKK